MTYLGTYDEATLPLIAELLEAEFDQPIEDLLNDEAGCYHGTKWINTPLIVRLVALAYEQGQEDGPRE